MVDRNREIPGSSIPPETSPNPPDTKFPEFRVTFVATFVLVLISGFWFWTALGREGIVQPIAFNHLLHAENGLECVDCHTGVQESVAAGFPSNELCMMCHEEPLGDSAEEKRLIEYLAGDEPIPWESLFRQPAHVFYSHRRHVVSAELECSTCHGGMGESEEPPRRVPFKLKMNGCIDCHYSAGVSNDCTICHR